ncbi:isocitrate lyase/PEP mutase family protein [Phytoactinopolyspora mesophila]|uniref:Isocitrate lyase/phosphoenolpyruvate mutase family protein n=1 Tax=Phytoactinopolyspora mesophila TaxID=2650750 RepID=A0A7K3MC27_9ACTN|nr:isocitrate lyase/phosphoenolpyruvate mutase family protein [Phytoactinopolyspora mesophila]NDL60577.1 isocitrate lyase/phosphoenolpyruvate mutase family protein [Phytoactinopolyspora mesophila]
MTDRFRSMHDDGLFIMPNAWDAGSARILEHLGSAALATTSSGHASSLGRLDQHVRREEMLAHAEAIVEAVSVPVSVDSEGCYPSSPGGVARTVELIAGTGAAGCSIEDYEPSVGVLPVDLATERVRVAAEVADRHGLVLTARADNHLYGVDDLTDTVERLASYRAAGAHVVYAPGLTAAVDIERLVREVGGAVNVLTLPGVPSTAELAALGVRRVSVGGSLAWVAYGALATAARELLSDGTTSYLTSSLAPEVRDAAFAAD